MAKSHPHIDQPTDDQLTELAAAQPESLRETYLALHRLVLDAVPGIEASVDTVDGQIGYGAHQFGYNGWGMAALSPHRNWVSLVFLRGTALDDPDGLLEGTGAAVRHVKFRSPEQLAERRVAVKRLLEQAARLNLA